MQPWKCNSEINCWRNLMSFWPCLPVLYSVNFVRKGRYVLPTYDTAQCQGMLSEAAGLRSKTTAKCPKLWWSHCAYKVTWCNSNTVRVLKLTQCVRVLVVKCDELISTPRTHIVEQENWFLQIVLWPPITGRGKRSTLPKNWLMPTCIPGGFLSPLLNTP